MWTIFFLNLQNKLQIRHTPFIHPLLLSTLKSDNSLLSALSWKGDKTEAPLFSHSRCYFCFDLQRPSPNHSLRVWTKRSITKTTATAPSGTRLHCALRCIFLLGNLKSACRSFKSSAEWPPLRVSDFLSIRPSVFHHGDPVKKNKKTRNFQKRERKKKTLHVFSSVHLYGLLAAFWCFTVPVWLTLLSGCKKNWPNLGLVRTLKERKRLQAGLKHVEVKIFEDAPWDHLSF